MSVNNCQYAKRISAQHPILRETVARGALVIKWGQHQYVMQFHIKVRTRNIEVKITGTLHFAGCLLCNVDINIISEKGEKLFSTVM